MPPWRSRTSSAILPRGRRSKQAILDGSSQIAVPAFVSTLCICIVFLPMFLLAGVSKFLFVPLAEAVMFAMLASYFFSRTIVPTMALYLLKSGDHTSGHRNLFSRIQPAFQGGFERLRLSYQLLLTTAVHRRAIFIPAFLLVCFSAFLLVPWLGQNFFPDTDNGQFILHVRAQSGTRIEETAQICDLIEASIRHHVPAQEVDNILDNIGLPYSPFNFMHSTSGLIGTADADILVSLKEKHHPTGSYVRELRKTLPRDFPGVIFYFLPADMVTQVLNFGLPAPIDIQIEGADIDGNRQVADKMLAELRRVPGLTDLRIQQQFDYPAYDINVDRTKAAQGGLTERSVATSVLNSLSGSFQVTPNFLSQLEKWRELQSRRSDTAVQNSVPAGSGEHPCHHTRCIPLGNPGRCRLRQAHQRNGGHQSLQHSPPGGNLRKCAGSRPGFGCT